MKPHNVATSSIKHILALTFSYLIHIHFLDMSILDRGYVGLYNTVSSDQEKFTLDIVILFKFRSIYLIFNVVLFLKTTSVV
jgi:hypothetical protein